MRAGVILFANSALLLLNSVWELECALQELVDAVLVPVPKKCDLTLCNNWHGIALLDVVGKVVAQIIQSQLYLFAESIL